MAPLLPPQSEILLPDLRRTSGKLNTEFYSALPRFVDSKAARHGTEGALESQFLHSAALASLLCVGNSWLGTWMATTWLTVLPQRLNSHMWGLHQRITKGEVPLYHKTNQHNAW